MILSLSAGAIWRISASARVATAMPRPSAPARGRLPRAAVPRMARLLTAINNLGTLLQKEKKYAEAERLFRECLDLRRAIERPRASRHDRDRLQPGLRAQRARTG